MVEIVRGSGGNSERERKGSGGKQGQRGGTKGRVEKFKRRSHSKNNLKSREVI